MQLKVIKLKRLWNNLASTRDYQIQECLLRGQGIRFELEGSDEFMEIPVDQLKQKSFQANKTLQKSRFGKDYYLVDFAWRPTKNTVKQQPLFQDNSRENLNNWS